MLKKFSPNWDFVLPLASHCLVHAGFTFLISCWWLDHFGMLADYCLLPPILAGIDFICHFIMDRIKAGPRYLGRFKALSEEKMRHILSYLPRLGEEGVREKFGAELRGNTFFWWSLGLDQLVHGLTDLLIVYLLVSL